MKPLLENLEKNRSLKDLCTFGIGGPAKYFLEVRSIEQMNHALCLCAEQRIPFFILGKGSNLLFDDRGFDGLVIANRIDFIHQLDSHLFHVGAGYSFSLLGTKTARQGLSGLEFASGIPGSVGGAIYMNAGANGGETCQTLMEVEYLTPEGHLLHLKREEIEFSYRSSSFQKWQGAIVGAKFQLTSSSDAREKQLKLFNYRKKTQPYDQKSAGCIFRNPTCHHAGALIEQQGLKGARIGGAEVSTLHANFVINCEQATSHEVLALISLIRDTVHAQTGIRLESEVKFVPYQVSERLNE